MARGAASDPLCVKSTLLQVPSDFFQGKSVAPTEVTFHPKSGAYAPTHLALSGVFCRGKLRQNTRGLPI